MFENIFKSILWFTFHFVVTILGIIGVYIISDITPETILPPYSALERLVLLGIGISAIICIIVFCLYKILCKHSFDLKKIEWRKAVLALGIGLFTNAVLNTILEIIIKFLPEKMVESLTDATSTSIDNSYPLLIVILITGVLGPIMEEIIFRYGVHGTLARSNVVVAYIVSSIIFGLMHGNVIQSTYTILLGVIFAFLFTSGGNLWYPIIAHMSINTASVIISRFQQQSYYILIGVFLIGLILIILMRKELRSMFKKRRDNGA